MNLRQSQSSEAEQSSHFSESDSHTSGERRRIKPPPPRGTRLGMGNIPIIAPPPAPRCAPSLPSKRETTLGLVAPVPAPSPVPHVPVKIGTPVLPPMTSTEIANVVAGVAMTPVVQKRTVGLEGRARKAPPPPVRNTLAHAPTMMQPMPPPPSTRKGGTMIMTASAPQTPPPASSLEEHVDRVDPDGVRVVSMTRDGVPLSAADLRALRHHMPVVASTPTLFVDDAEIIEENSQMKSFGQCSTNGPRQPKPAPTTEPELETLDPDDLEQDGSAPHPSPQLANATAAARKALTNTQPPGQTSNITPRPPSSQPAPEESVIVDPEKLQQQAQAKSARGLSYSSELQEDLARNDLERAQNSDMPIDQLSGMIYTAESKLVDDETLPRVKESYKQIYFVCAERLINTVGQSNDRKGLLALSEAMQKRLERSEVLSGSHAVSQRIKEMCDQRIAQLPQSNPPAAPASQTPAASPQPAPGRAPSSKPPTKGGTVMMRQSPLPPPIRAAQGSSHPAPARLQLPSTPAVPAPGTALPLAANGSGAPPAPRTPLPPPTQPPPRISPPPPSSQRASREGQRPLGTPPVPTGLDLGPVQVPPPPSSKGPYHPIPASRRNPPAAPSSKPPALQRVQEPPRPAANSQDVVMVAVPRQAGVPTTFLTEEVLLSKAKRFLQEVKDDLTSIEDIRAIRDAVRTAMNEDNPPSVEEVYGQVIAVCAKRMQPSAKDSPLATPPTFPGANQCPPTVPMTATKTQRPQPQPKTDGLLLYVTVFVLGIGLIWLALWTFHQKPESESERQNTSEQRNVGEH